LFFEISSVDRMLEYSFTSDLKKQDSAVILIKTRGIGGRP